jgi:hypothetical protein
MTPVRSRSLSHRAHLLVVVVLLVGCAEERRYVGDGLVTVAITEDTAPLFETEEGAIYVVETRVDLPLREPTQMTIDDLYQGAQGYEGLPFPRLPLASRGDIETQIDFTISSLDDEEREIGVIVNGYNEFHEYVPGVIEIDDEPTPDFSQWERVYTLAPGARLSTTVREDELDEVAVDLATVVNGAPSSAEIVYFENHSSDDTRAAPYIPQVIPALVGVRIGLRTLTPARVLLEASVRVRDVDGVLAEEGDPELVANPEPFMPVAPEN